MNVGVGDRGWIATEFTCSVRVRVTAHKALRILERRTGGPLSSPLDTFYLPLLAA